MGKRTLSKPKPKATAETVKARIFDVVRLMLDGAQPWDVTAYVSEQEAKGEAPWTIPPCGKPLCERTIRRYCRRAEQVIGAGCQADREALVRRHIAQRRQLYARAVAKGDERTALACARDEAELLALYPAHRTEVSGPNGGPLLTVAAVATMSETERLERVRGLIAAARARATPLLPFTNINSTAAHEADGAGGTENGK
jgi:hypothetical protein